MKNSIRLIMLVAAIFLFAGTATAAQRKRNGSAQREQLAEKQAKHIAEKLCFSPEVSEKFIATYLECQKETWGARTVKNRTRNKSLTEAQTDSLLRSRFDHSQKLLDIRKKYYDEYSKFLSAKQIKRVYEMEEQMMKRFVRKADKKKSTAGNRKKR